MKQEPILKRDCNLLPDIQDIKDKRGLKIDKVGVRGITHPIQVKDRSRKEQHTVATFNMYVTLPENLKGTHMSRFVEILNEHEYEITVKSFKKMISKMKTRLNAESGIIEMSFPYFIVKSAPVSKTKSIIDYKVTFIGEENHNEYSLKLKVVVPVTSLCPCSKAISSFGAHNQRSIVTLTAQIRRFVWIEELIEMVEKEASCELYGVLKRADEKYVTEYAYRNPKFVEDIVRDITVKINEDDRIVNYTVESENFESIHNHSAFALITRDKGFEQRYISSSSETRSSRGPRVKTGPEFKA